MKKEKRKYLKGKWCGGCDILKLLNKTNISHEMSVFYKSDKYYLPKYTGGVPCHFFFMDSTLFFEKVSQR